MTLTRDQKNAVEHGQAVPITLDGTDCIVVRRDVYERLSRAEYDDTEWHEDELRALASRTFDEADTAEIR